MPLPISTVAVLPPTRSYRSYIPCHNTVAHGEDYFDDDVVRRGGASTDVNDGSGYAANGITHIVDHSLQEIEAISPRSRNTIVAREHAYHTELRHSSTPTSNTGDIPFRVETKRVYICTHTGCNKKYSRMPDLRRHYRGSHLDDRPFQCRALGCERAIHGFPRRDKRDVHEKKMHIDIGNGILL